MSLIAIPNIYTPGQKLAAASLNQNFSTIYNDYNGNITNANLSASAGIILSKLQLNPGSSALNYQTTGNDAWGAGLTGDSQPRIVMTSDGALQFGAGGSTVPDVEFIHSAAKTVQLNDTAGGPAILDLNGGSIINSTVSVPNIQGLRISISSTLPLPADGTSTTIYALPYISGYIALYNASNLWVTDVVTSLSIAVPATTNTNYDVYVFDNSGTATIGLAAWSGNTPPTRGTQNGVPYTNGSVHDRWIGCMATNGTSGTTEDSSGNRLVWNYNNQIQRPLFAQVPVSTWTYNVSTWRASNANTTIGQGRVGVLVGLANWTTYAQFIQSGTDAQARYAGINLDSSTATPSQYLGNGDNIVPLSVSTNFILSQGFHYLQMMECVNGPSTSTFTGNPSFVSSNLYGQSWLAGSITG